MHRAIATVLLSLLPALLQAQITELRQARLYVGDVAELTISFDAGIPSMYAVDTSALQTDFAVLDSKSRVFRVQQDGQSMHRMQWSIRLLPERSGTLTIPPLKFGDNYSQALQLVVEPVPADLQTTQNVFVEIEASPHNPYPGQQTRIVTRLFHNLAIDRGVLNEPVPAKSRVFRSGRDLHYDVLRDGHRFTVLERSILLIPSKVAELQVQPATFSASFPSVNSRHGPALAGGVRYIHRSSNALQLKQREIPAGIEATDWLPAQRLELSLEWEKRDATLRPGDSLGVVLNIQAKGLPAEVLPANLLIGDSDRFKIYADRETRSTRVIGTPGDAQLAGHLRQRYAIVLERAGEVTLPAVKLDWWDVGQDRARVARVEATTLTVAAAVSTNDGIRDRDLVAAGDPATLAGGQPHGPRAAWAWLAGALGGIALAWYTRRHWSRVAALYKALRQRRRCLKNVERACSSNDAIAARIGLLEWSRAHWGDPRIYSLRQLAARTSDDWVGALARLDAAVFAAHQRAWQGDELRRLIRRQHRNPGASNAQQAANELPGPYPRTAPIRRATTNPQPV